MIDNNEQSFSSLIDGARESLKNHDITMAYEYLWTAKNDEPENVEILNLIAHCHLIWGDFEKAEASWKQVIALDAANSDASARLSDFHSPSFQFWLKKYYEAVSQVENRHYEEAQQLLWNLLKENDGFVGVYQLLGLSCLATSEKDTARKVWQRGLEIDQSNQLILNYLELVASNHDPEIAPKEEEEENFTWRQFLSGRWLAWGVAAVLCLALIVQTGMFYSARHTKNQMVRDMQTQIALLNRKIASKSPGIPVLASRNEASFLTNSAGVKEQAAEGGSDIDESKEGFYYAQGYKAYLEGDFTRACSNLGMVVDMNTGSYRNREALYYLALLHYFKSDYKNAGERFEKYIRDYPNSNYFDESLYYLGCIYQSEGQDDKALLYFQKLQEVAPRSGYLTAATVKEVLQSN